MTETREKALYSVVENLWFKGLARLAMLVVGGVISIGIPLGIQLGSRTYDAIDNLNKNYSEMKATMNNNQAKMDGQFVRIELMQTNDRSNSSDALKSANNRVDILSERISKFQEAIQHDFARVGEVAAGLTLRDQRIDGIENRLKSAEQVIYNRQDRVIK